LPGEFYVTQEQEMITTVLGSCVAACIFDPTTGFGGMNHFMLPGDPSGGEDDLSARYGLFAMESLINEILKCGCAKQNLRVKLFGGGQIIENMSDVGKKNVHFAKTFVYAEGLELVGSDVGLIYPRKVNFFPATGKVMVKRLRTLHNTTIQDRERQYLKTLKKEATGGEVELF
jgi:chemotaxis protein CheD